MGYGIGTSAMYGVSLSADEAHKMAEVLENLFGSDWTGELEGCNANDWLMVAEDTDSRIHNNTYEPGYEHVLGVLIASKGYGSAWTTDGFERALRADWTPQETVFKKDLEPLLIQAGIVKSPGLVMGSCVY